MPWYFFFENWPTLRKDLFSDQEKLLTINFQAFNLEFEITRTTYSNIEKSEHFLKTNIF